MAHQRWWLGVLAAAGLCIFLRADTPKPLALQSGSVSGLAVPAIRDPSNLTGRIDQLIAAGLGDAKIPAAPLSDDAEFLRRVYLDLTGKIPSVTQARQFLGDPAPDRRQKLIDRLLDSGGYVRHFTNFWRSVLLPETFAVADNGGLRAGLMAWLRQRLADNIPYDKMVRDLIQPGGPRAFYQANENKPENLAASTARIFLGVKLECAQCHSHPFAPWRREQFWGLAAFYTGLPQPGQRGRAAPVANPPQIRIPGTEKIAPARFLDDKLPEFTDGADPRVLLANWVTAADNPYFARAVVNRVWAHFFGIGLVDPVDEMGAQNAASYPELLDELGRDFTAHRFDLKYLIRAIVSSQTYQRTSRVIDATHDNPRSFARMSVKTMTAEQLFDSLAEATGYQEPTRSSQSSGRGQGARSSFLAKFANPSGKQTESQLSILQALALMNGKLIAEVTDLDRSETLAAILDAPFMDTPGRLDALYLAALTRKPNPQEAERLIKYVRDGGSDGSPNKALADVFWALLNSGEFILNH
jgi:hypothetical protein